MARTKRITVRGKPQWDIDPLLFLHVLFAIADQKDSDKISSSPDAHDALIDDWLEAPR